MKNHTIKTPLAVAEIRAHLRGASSPYPTMIVRGPGHTEYPFFRQELGELFFRRYVADAEDTPENVARGIFPLARAQEDMVDIQNGIQVGYFKVYWRILTVEEFAEEQAALVVAQKEKDDFDTEHHRQVQETAEKQADLDRQKQELASGALVAPAPKPAPKRKNTALAALETSVAGAGV